MPRVKIIPNIEEVAKRYQVSTRSVRRWHKAGADVNSSESIADLLLRQRNPKPESIQSVLTQLSK